MSDPSRAGKPRQPPAEKAASLDDVLAELDERIALVIRLAEQLVRKKLPA